LRNYKHKIAEKEVSKEKGIREKRLVDEMSDDERLGLWDRPYQKRWPVSGKEKALALSQS